MDDGDDNSGAKQRQNSGWANIVPHQWPKGKSGNEKGRKPKRPIQEAMERELEESPHLARFLAREFLKLSVTDASAMREVWNRLDGRIPVGETREIPDIVVEVQGGVIADEEDELERAERDADEHEERAADTTDIEEASDPEDESRPTIVELDVEIEDSPADDGEDHADEDGEPDDGE